MKKALCVFSLFAVCVFLLGCYGGYEVLPKLPDDGRTVIVLDAGHGFADPGCLSEYLLGTEAETTLEMVKILERELVSLGAEVILTHDGESFPTAEELISLCNQTETPYDAELVGDDTVFSAYERGIYVLALSKQVQIDFFVSVHVNSFPDNPDVDRYELFYCKENVYSHIIRDFCSSFEGRLDKKVRIEGFDRQNAYTVTKYGEYPSVLVETGFASNPQAAASLNDEEWRQSFCKALAEELIDSLK